ncbi:MULTISPECIES: GntR family transcriptional regulator [Achromobacter]|jgi:DNA-binding GntR family transcriptional regulator|uniref:HTH-type transcriptional regulator McbR n=1 Tax=Achromobacter animicus TaxID=1389935 RepID=A0A6S7AKV7_9BURK|nr:MULTISPECIES: GntR family transcriptional regulator [Achromobacter]KQZ96628.1 GntR family transcriptional regulator [Achromobacter sp. Root565]MBV7500333.1 GntR family transcriptional regulator [Achromobacter sp. ACM05]MCG7327790.1 GntR family transcriptional regulator [Achromobacter sp. ACRQX]MDH0682825.1 GntR family transcriptional regulator [Achromobacter animicus]CAB3735377.1 HTH-type transcriptional regulator McbR [Achromobacter animicus]
MPSLKPVKKENLSVRVYNEIRNALINGQYEPGERLIIGELAQEMGVSITPVREAIFRLISEQGLEMQAATAVYVPYVNSEKLREIQQIRFHLEGMGAAEAAQNITRKQLDNLIALQRDFISCTSTDPKRASYLNRKFHFAILEASNKPILRNTVESFWVITGPILKVFHVKTAGLDYSENEHRHEAVIEALEARDSEAARNAIQADLVWGGKIMIDWLVEREKELDYRPPGARK